MEGVQVSKDLDLDIDGGNVIIKGKLGAGDLVSGELTLNVGIVPILKLIAERTPNKIDDAAVPYVQLIMAALDKK